MQCCGEIRDLQYSVLPCMDVWDPANNSTKTSNTVECEVFLQNDIP